MALVELYLTICTVCTVCRKEAQKYADKEDKTHTPSSATEPEGQGSESNPETKDTSSGAVAVDNTSGSAATRPRLYSASQVHFGRILNQASAFGEYRQCPDYVSDVIIVL